ncbi:multicopper oxidase-domain-containing protein [Mycena alexandri]|uniref:Multicopper oxidase-domain-containing protein n=1 Tax=Mycena alexandri TaxID=1745969 RepID=A0AAD6SRG3_9AGAR|nr:multicopper oxidase-domain-containing protein [Mycena alexandri]
MRRRILATGVLVLLVIPLAFLLCIASWPRQPPANDHGQPPIPDKFRLDPTSDASASPARTNPVETAPEPVPDSLVLEGQGGGAQDREEGNPAGYFEVMVKPGTTTRLRLTNAGSLAPIRLFIENHVLTVIEADGTPVIPVRVRDLVLQPAQRYSCSSPRPLTSPRTSRQALWIRARKIDEKSANEKWSPKRARCCGTPSRTTTPPPQPRSSGCPPAGDTGEWDSLHHFDEWALRPLVAPPKRQQRPPANAALTIPFKFSIQRTHEQNWGSFINGTSWEIPPPGEAVLVSDLARVGSGEGSVGVKVWPIDQVIAALEYNRTVDFVITNLDDMGDCQVW